MFLFMASLFFACSNSQTVAENSDSETFSVAEPYQDKALAATDQAKLYVTNSVTGEERVNAICMESGDGYNCAASWHESGAMKSIKLFCYDIGCVPTSEATSVTETIQTTRTEQTTGGAPVVVNVSSDEAERDYLLWLMVLSSSNSSYSSWTSGGRSKTSYNYYYTGSNTPSTTSYSSGSYNKNTGSSYNSASKTTSTGSTYTYKAPQKTTTTTTTYKASPKPSSTYKSPTRSSGYGTSNRSSGYSRSSGGRR